jgi:eukaryotic-like serine/threonine-protein kinase
LALASGTRLGVYEVTAQIGQGGMGQVYRARDTKLDRDVAIKILPEAFAHDADRLARFTREAQTLASLNHPHIAAIYGLEESGGVRALVMELVEGEDLSQRIARGAIPLDEALPIAKQIADALEAAHEQGIIHRDLKPANIKVRSDGTVKVLDFGLAKAMEPAAGSSPSMSQSPTITTPAATRMGVIMGTAAYMSPEQAKGKVIDKRTDIWAFGCVLYEMVTGTRAFEGEEVSEVLARILERDPDFSALPSTTPPAIRRLLRRCLEKDRKRRLDSAADARLEIDEALTAPAEHLVASTAQPRNVGWRSALGAALLTGGVLAIAATLYVRRPAPAPVITRLEISTPGTGYPFQFALSPDGRRLVFVTGATGPPQLAVRVLDQVGVQILAGTEGASYPFWAPDSRTIGFAAGGKLKRIDLSGGGPQALADVPGFRGGTWNDEGVIVFAPTPASGLGLMRVSATGGTPVVVTHLATGQSFLQHSWPQFLPDGRRVLFFVGSNVAPTRRGVYVASLDGGEPMRVVAAETHARYAPPGYLLRVSQGVLVAQRFDAARATVSGDLVPVAQGVGQNDGNFLSAFSVSATGILAHRSGVGASRRQLVWLDRTGKVLGVVGPPDENFPSSPALAPDDRRVANGRIVQGNSDVWLTDVAREVATKFTFDPATEVSPVWSPEGSRVVFRSLRNGPSDLFVKPANGATDEQPLLVTPQNKTPLDWSRDGRFLLYANLDPKTQSDLWVLPLAPSTGAADARKPFPVVQTAFDETQGQFSPDGHWLVYTSNESGREEIYVRPFPESGGKWQVSTAGGSQPRWRVDGKELFYVAADARLMAVPIRVTPDGRAVDAGTPVALFRTRLATGANITLSGWQSRALYAVARDGRFLMNVNVDAGAADVSPLTIVLNWDAGLKK